MSEISRIRDLYQRTLHGDPWYGGPVWKILDSVLPEQAFDPVLPAAHTIWQVVAHMTFWEAEVRDRLGRILPDRIEDYNKHNNNEISPLQEQHYYETYNFPVAPPASAENWTRVLGSFRDSNTQFDLALSQLTDDDLDRPLSAPDKPVYLEIQGVIQHHIYHAGQVAILLKKWGSSKVPAGL